MEQEESMTRDTDKVFCRIIADIMASHGLTDVVCSPGSRNVPMLAAVDAHQSLRTHIVIDERSAAFMALGMATVSRRPVALICTSGTALLNYAPAVAEAYYQGIPLIVISTDRPVQWLDQDDSQTINQYEALRRFVKQSYDIGADNNPDKELEWYVNRIANDAMIEAISRREGPVHINLRLAPPLGQHATHPLPRQRVIEMTSADGSLSRRQIDMLAEEASKGTILLIAGFMRPDDRLNRAVNAMSRLPNTVVMCETVSNLHVSATDTMVDSVLTSIPQQQLDSLRPDLVITIGGALISRQVKEWMRRSHPPKHWAIGYSHTTTDSLQSLTRRIDAPAPAVLAPLAKALAHKKLQEGYSRCWKELRQKALASTRDFTSKAPWCELKAFGRLLDNIPADCNLFLSNGTSVRYAQILTTKMPHACYCNRGVSGIDGSTSTAAGGAMVYNGPTLLITGDMSLAYDLSGLSLHQMPDSMRIAVINNSGGGIFRFIGAGVSEDMRERMLCADPGTDIRALANAFGWHYLHADSIASLDKALKVFFDTTLTKTMLEIKVPGELSAEILKDYMHRHTHNSDGHGTNR